MITLHPNTIERIRESKKLKKAITNELDCSERILYRDLASNSVKLTQARVLNIIVEFTQLPLSEIITGDKLSKLMSK